MEQEKIDYGKTLNLPKTDFPMRGNLPQKEPEILKFWEENDIYHLVEKEMRASPNLSFMTARRMPTATFI